MNERYTYLTGQRDDVAQSKRELEKVIAEITGEMKTIFSQQFGVINTAFGETFAELFGGGKATLELDDPEDILNCGIEIRVQPPGKALKVLSLLSGGEKAFVAIALYFAILKVRPTPFCVMDEIEAALDDANVARFARYLARHERPDPVHRHHPSPRDHGGGRRPLRRHHAGTGDQPAADHQSERCGAGAEPEVTGEISGTTPIAGKN